MKEITLNEKNAPSEAYLEPQLQDWINADSIKENLIALNLFQSDNPFTFESIKNLTSVLYEKFSQVPGLKKKFNFKLPETFEAFAFQRIALITNAQLLENVDILNEFSMSNRVYNGDKKEEESEDFFDAPEPTSTGLQKSRNNEEIIISKEESGSSSSDSDSDNESTSIMNNASTQENGKLIQLEESLQNLADMSSESPSRAAIEEAIDSISNQVNEMSNESLVKNVDKIKSKIETTSRVVSESPLSDEVKDEIKFKLTDISAFSLFSMQ